MKRQTGKAGDLIAAIQRRTPTTAASASSAAAAVAEPEPQAASPVPRARRDARKPRGAGKAVQFWLHDEDRKLVRELAAWFASQGHRPTDSLVIRTALRVAKTGNELLEAYRQVAQLDGRLKQHRETAESA